MVPPEDGAYFWICKTHQNGTSSGCRTRFQSLPVATYSGSLNKEKGGDETDEFEAPRPRKKSKRDKGGEEEGEEDGGGAGIRGCAVVRR